MTAIQKQIDVFSDKDDATAYVFVPSEPQRINEFISLRTRKRDISRLKYLRETALLSTRN